MDKKRFRVAPDPTYGYLRLDPVPSAAELDAWYRDEYYGLVAAGGRACEIRRLMQGGAEAESEIAWLRKTRWDDVVTAIDGHSADRIRLLDFGCGTGHFLGFCRETTPWGVTGIEPAPEGARRAREQGLTVYGSVEECRRAGECGFDAVVLLHVLEHVPDPAGTINELKTLMAPGSLLAIAVPNDFSPLQESAARLLSAEPWWIAIPDHINYFNFGSLTGLLNQLGFEVVEQLTEFPMELFLLFGDNYLGNPELGAACHRKRVNFDLSLPADVRRRLYAALAREGMGRQCTVVARWSGA